MVDTKNKKFPIYAVIFTVVVKLLFFINTLYSGRCFYHLESCPESIGLRSNRLQW